MNLQHSLSPSRPRVEAAFFCLILVYGNVAAAFVGPNVLTPSWRGFIDGVGIILIALLGVYLFALTRDEIGAKSSVWKRSLALGFGLGLGAVVISALFLHFANIAGSKIHYAPAAHTTTAALLLHSGFLLPLLTVVPEEILFRGVLLGLLLRTLSRWRAIIVSSSLFVAWHIVVQTFTIEQSGIHGAGIIILAAIGACITLFVGGALFAYLRLRLGLFAAVACHWTFDGGLVLALHWFH